MKAQQIEFCAISFCLYLARAIAGSSGGVACSSMVAPTVPGATVKNFTAVELHNVTVDASPPLLPDTISNLNVCAVEVNITHGPSADDHVRILTWLPLTDWNKRFLGTGGSGYAAGFFELALAPGVAQGFAAASTDAGLTVNPYSPGAWALDNGHVNQDLLENFAHRSIHDMTVVGKAMVAQFYNTSDYYSYWDGCSTGGRQGLQTAQRYPNDFDGIVAGAPAINWAEYVLAGHWPQSIMKEEGYISNCELDALTKAAIAACDKLDGVADGVITDPSTCDFDAFEAVGLAISCDSASTVTAQAARVVNQIWRGPGWWYGLEKGAPLTSLGNSTVINSTLIGVPFFVDDAWIKYYLKQDPTFDTETVNISDLHALFQQSVQLYDNVIGASNPDLSDFKQAGNKVLVWHGLADQLIFPQGTIQYFDAVAQKTGGIDDFFRLFLAPGVDHCAGGTTPGAPPLNPLAALIDWVEKGVTPNTLVAGKADGSNLTTSRTLCAYPSRQVYNGTGDVTNAASFDCI